MTNFYDDYCFVIYTTQQYALNPAFPGFMGLNVALTSHDAAERYVLYDLSEGYDNNRYFNKVYFPGNPVTMVPPSVFYRSDLESILKEAHTRVGDKVSGFYKKNELDVDTIRVGDLLLNTTLVLEPVGTNVHQLYRVVKIRESKFFSNWLGKYKCVRIDGHKKNVVNTSFDDIADNSSIYKLTNADYHRLLRPPK